MKPTRKLPAGGRPGVSMTKGLALIEERNHAGLLQDIAPSAIATWTAPDGRSIRTVDVVHWWIEAALEDQWKGWIVAGRVMADDRGLPVLAELRVFPDEPDRGAQAGTWSAEVLGHAARARVPRGGIPATLIRRGLPLATLARMASETFQMFGILPQFQIPGHPVLDGDRGLAATARAAGYVLRERRAPANTKRGRPRLWNNGDYARVALTYDDAKHERRSPIDAISRSEGISTANARNLVAQARKAGRLPEAAGSGKETPRLPPKMRAALRREATSRRKRDHH